MSAFLISPSPDYMFRLLLATVCGAAIGIERSFRRKEAGVRTHAILALASALFMILSKYAFFNAQGGADPTMIACQIVMGINFLGAGIIFRSKRTMTTGLTTTAGIWATTAIGMACGAGMELLAVLCTGFVLCLQLFMNKFNIGGSSLLPQELRITVINTPGIWAVLQEAKQHHEMEILTMRYKQKHEDHTVTLILQVRTRTPITPMEAIRFMDQHKEIREISV